MILAKVLTGGVIQVIIFSVTFSSFIAIYSSYNRLSSIADQMLRFNAIDSYLADNLKQVIRPYFIAEEDTFIIHNDDSVIFYYYQGLSNQSITIDYSPVSVRNLSTDDEYTLNFAIIQNLNVTANAVEITYNLFDRYIFKRKYFF